MSKQPTCETCRFWRGKTKDENKGQCRRYPPQINGQYHLEIVPDTRPEFWCGEHQPRKGE